MQTAIPYSSELLKGEGGQRVFNGRNLLQIALPLGGIGAGVYFYTLSVPQQFDRVFYSTGASGYNAQ